MGILLQVSLYSETLSVSWEFMCKTLWTNIVQSLIVTISGYDISCISCMENLLWRKQYNFDANKPVFRNIVYLTLREEREYILLNILVSFFNLPSVKAFSQLPPLSYVKSTLVTGARAIALLGPLSLLHLIFALMMVCVGRQIWI